MVASQAVCAVFSGLALLSTGIRAQTETNPCPAKAVVDLTATNSVQNSERMLGCPCRFKTCLSLCCLPGEARIEGNCVEDNATSGILPLVRVSTKEEMRDERNFHLFADDPCLIGWMTPTLIENYYVFENGSIYSPDFGGGSLSEFGEYCLYRKPRSSVYSAKVCRPLVQKTWDILCLSLSILLMLTTYLGYAIVPELRNFHGLIFRSYVGTYVGAYAWTLGAQLSTQSQNHAQLYSICVFFGHFGAISCSLWMTVMSFNIWRTFRGFRSADFHSKQRERKMYMWYAMYAWGTALALVASCVAAMRYIPYFRNDTYGETLKQWGSVGLVVIVFANNSYMYASTALTIRRHKKDTAGLIECVNKHRAIDKQWFNLHVKLFSIMGAHILMWAIWVIWSTSFMSGLLVATEVLQSFLIFVIFLWKNTIRQSIRNRFVENMNRLMTSQESSQSSNNATDS